MNSILKIIRCCIAIILIGALLMQDAFCATRIPRLWTATSNASDGTITKFYFLAATHGGLSVEYDSYFQDVVIPSFKASDELYFEGAGSGVEENKPICDVSILDKNGLDVLNSARAAVAETIFQALELIHEQQNKHGEKNYQTSEIRKKIAEDISLRSDEFDLIETNKSYQMVIDSFSAEKKQTVTNKNIINELINLNKNIKYKDLDSKYGVRQAYCNSGPSRINFLKDFIIGQSSSVMEGESSDSGLSLDFEEIVGGKDPSSNSPFFKLADLDQNLLCKRTEKWIKNIQTINDGKTHFFVIGARHFHSVNHDGIQCKGLLDWLPAIGIQPILIN